MSPLKAQTIPGLVFYDPKAWRHTESRGYYDATRNSEGNHQTRQNTPF
jgi:hypothetical protein